MNEKFPQNPTSPSTPETLLDHQGYDESPSEIYEYYLEELELTDSDLEGKQILDIGAGSAGFAAGVKEKGINAHVVSVDNDVSLEEKIPHEKESYVVATAQKLPFADNTFDLVVSMYAMPHVAAVSDPKLGTSTGEVIDGIPVRDASRLFDGKYEEERAVSVAQAVRECIRVTKEGGEIRFGGVTMKKAESEFDEEGLPTYPYVIKNTGAMKGLLDGSEGTTRLVKYPTSEDDELFILRKLTEAERPWMSDPTPPGTPIQLASIDIHPEFTEAAKQFTQMAAEIHQAETGEAIPPSEVFGRLLETEGVVDEEGGARFPLGNDPEDPGYFRIPEGYWKLSRGT